MTGPVLDWTLVEWDVDRHPERPQIVLGGYRRASTYGQRDGWRFQETLNDLRGMAFSKGWGIVYFDEGTRSGQTISGRSSMTSMLDWLRAGLLHGILVPDIKRLTRDRTMVDGLEIAKVLQERRGMLVTGRRIWDLTDRFDMQAYRREVFQAGEDLINIRDTFYEGMEDRAQRVARGDAPPFWRGPAPIGYRFAVCHWPRDPQLKWTTDETAGTGIMTSRGIVIRTIVKDELNESIILALYTELCGQPSLGEVARALNQTGILSPWKSKGEDQPNGWSAKLLRQILRTPLYCGRWQWIRERGDTDLWYSFDPSHGRDFPELAYWTTDEHATFRARFLEGYSPRRQSAHAHPWVGLGACPGCGEAFIASGRDATTKGHSGKLRCPNYRAPAKCAQRGTIAEDGIRRALDDIFPRALEWMASRRGEILARVTERKSNPKRSQLAALKRSEASLLDIVQDPDIDSAEAKQRLRQVTEQRRTLEQQLVNQPVEDDDALEARARALGEMFDHDPAAVYAEMTEVEKAVLWRLLLTDDSGTLHPVPIERLTKGNGQSPAKYGLTAAPVFAQAEGFWNLFRRARSRVA